MNLNLLRPAVQKFIHLNEKSDINKLLLSGIQFDGVKPAEVADQIFGIKTVRAKAPSLVKDGIIYPPKLNLEQSSSELTARYKQKLLPKQCESFLDLTGGFGVDSFFLSKNITKSTYCEKNQMLADIVEHNFKIHNRNIEVIKGDGVEWLKNIDKSFSCIFIDPSRRDGYKKVISLEQSTPNLFEIWELVLEKSDTIIVKLSPMLDISYLLNHLSNIHELHVVSVKQDVKEIILVTKKGQSSHPKIIASTINEDRILSFAQSHNDPIKMERQLLGFNYLYEPFSVLLKAGIYDEYASHFGLNKVDHNTHLYFTKELVNVPMCKRFKIFGETKLDKKEVIKFTMVKKINVVSRNYPLSPEQVLHKLKFKQGGESTLFCFKMQGENKVLLSKRIK